MTSTSAPRRGFYPAGGAHLCVFRRDSLFGGRVVVAQQTAAFGRYADNGAIAHQTRLELLQ
jgi:hypothetical protein